MDKLNREQKIERFKLLNELFKRKSRTDLKSFVQYTKKDYEMRWFHKVICDKLTSLLDGTLGKKKLMIFVPPQHGKSELSSRRFPAFALGKNPNMRIALCSYSSDLASTFNRNIQTIIDDSEYQEIFKNTKLNGQNVSTDTKRGALRNSTVFEIIGQTGFLKTVGVGGSLTGTSVDLGIIDDPYKDRKEANSQTIRNGVWDWYVDVFKTRLHNNSKQLLLFTRWHEDDLAGRILAEESDEWEVVAIPCLKESTPPLIEAVNINDPRELDEALWEEKHSAVEVRKRREHNPMTFNSLYQQRPTSAVGNLFKREWFDLIALIGSGYRHDIFIDGAYTTKTSNDPTAIMSIKHKKDEVIITDSSTYRLELFELLDQIDKYCEMVDFNKSTGIVYIEPKASGKSIKSMLSKKGYNCVELSNKVVSRGKMSRAEDSTPSVHGGKVKLLKGGWNDQFISEVISFPNGKHDDQLDNLCYAVNQYLIKPPKRGIKRRN